MRLANVPLKAPKAMTMTVLYAEKLYDNDKVERDMSEPEVRVVWRNVSSLSQLED
jgi:hypothetical protein